MGDTMQEIISQLSGTAAERRAQLAATVTIPSNRGRLTHTWVAENLGLAVADGVYNSIASISVPTAQRYAVGTGIDTTAETWKTQAEAVAVAVPALAPYLSTLRDFESLTVTTWQKMGGTSEVPSVEEIQSAMDEIEKQTIISTTRTAAASRHNNLKAWLDEYSLDGKTAEQVQAYCDDLLDSSDGNPTGGA